MSNSANSYQALRNTAAAYRRGDAILRITGTDRRTLGMRLLARSIEYAAVNTAVDSLLLDDDGSAIGTALAIQRDTDIVMMVDAPRTWIDIVRREARTLDVELNIENQIALAVEGPLSWKAAQAVLEDRPVEDVLLGDAVTCQIGGAEVVVARAGTIAEYGYVMIGDEGRIRDAVSPVLAELGDEADPQALRRARIESNYPVLPEQVRGADVLEAGIGWCMTLSREDGFIGSRVRDLPDPSRRVVAAYFDGACPEEGTSVLDTGERVGVVLVPAADCGQKSLALLLLDNPYGVPGLELESGTGTCRTVSRPTIAPVSWAQAIGAEQ